MIESTKKPLPRWLGWAAGTLAALAAAVCLGYYWRVFYYLDARGVPPLHTKKSEPELRRLVQSSLALAEKPAPGGGNAALWRSGCLYNA